MTAYSSSSNFQLLAVGDEPPEDVGRRGLPETGPLITPETRAIGTKEAPTVLTLYRFDSRDTAGRWAIVNDSVMGGISESGLALSDENVLLFSGTVSLDNNGGFASVRSTVQDYAVTDEEGIRLSIRGDGKLYRLRLYAAGLPGIAYEAPFQTVAGEWQTVDLPFVEFEPTIRGRVLSGYGPIDPASIEAVGIMVKDYQVGDFAIEVESIEAYR